MLAASLGACTGPGASQAYTGPGWYLEKSYIIVGGGPKVFGGPFTYDKCEEERIKIGADHLARDALRQPSRQAEPSTALTSRSRTGQDRRIAAVTKIG